MGGGGFSRGMAISLKNNKALRGHKPFNRDSYTQMPIYSKQKNLSQRPQESFIESIENRKSAELRKLIGYLAVILLMFIVLCGYLLYL